MVAQPYAGGSAVHSMVAQPYAVHWMVVTNSYVYVLCVGYDTCRLCGEQWTKPELQKNKRRKVEHKCRRDGTSSVQDSQDEEVHELEDEGPPHD